MADNTDLFSLAGKRVLVTGASKPWRGRAPR